MRQALEQAYLETAYQVLADPPFTLTVGERNAALARWQTGLGVVCSAFVTACNPRSRALPEALNTRREAMLARQLEDAGWRFVSALGKHPGNGWPGEPSFLVAGMGRETALALAAQWQQNAIVWSAGDAVPVLLWTPVPV